MQTTNTGWTATDLPALLAHMRPMRALVAVARHGSTVRAAQAMHTAQPAVARSIAKLEQACGLPLFARTARGMAPTPAGERLASRAYALFQHLASGAVEGVAAAPLAARPPRASERFHAFVAPVHLRALIAIGACGSEPRAAASLGVTQPAVHAALKRLEDLVSVRLFYKLAIGTRLTPAGEAVLRRVKLALAEAKAMEGDLAAWRGEIRGRLVVGVLPLSVGIFLPRAVQALSQSHPDIEIRIVDGTYDSLVRQLMSAEVDAIAGALRADAPATDMRQLHLFDDDLVVVARAGHPCLQRKLSGLRDLMRWPWVTPLPDTPADAALDEVFRRHRLAPPGKSLQASSPAMTLAFVMQTGRLAIASRGEALLEDHGGQLCIVPLALPSTRRRIGILTRATTDPSADLRLMLEACREASEAAGRCGLGGTP